MSNFIINQDVNIEVDMFAKYIYNFLGNLNKENLKTIMKNIKN